MIADSSVLLMAFFPDEAGHTQAQALVQAHALGAVELHAPTLLPYEITNAVLKAVSRERLAMEIAQEVLTTFESLGIALHPVPLASSLTLAHRYRRSAYDAAYLTLAEMLDTRFVTGDRRLYNAVQPHWPRVVWIGDFRPPTA